MRTGLLRISVFRNNVALDLFGMELFFQAKWVRSGPAIIAKSSANNGGIVVGSPTSAGVAILQIDPQDTSDIPDALSTPLLYDLSLVDGSNKYPLNSGTLQVLGNVSP